MLDPIFSAAASTINFFYGLTHSYAISIILLTLLVMVLTTPLTLKGTRSMIKMQLLQPELKRIQAAHKEDRQKQQEEMMKFYQENGVNPVGGCLPLLVQMPIFLLLYNVIRGLTRIPTGPGADGTFDPKYLDEGSELYRALDGQSEMLSFGLDLGHSTMDALRDSIVNGLPYLFLILLQVAFSYYQQRQVSARNKDGQVTIPAQQMILRFMPVMFGFISLNFPAALVVYWVTQAIFRIGVQSYITRSLYGGEGSLGAQAQAATKEARDLKEAADGSTRTKPKSDAKPKNKNDKDSGSNNGGPKKAAPVSSGRVTPSGGRPHPSSKKKNKKRR